jgi:hypothetical protein
MRCWSAAPKASSRVGPISMKRSRGLRRIQRRVQIASTRPASAPANRLPRSSPQSHRSR